MAWKETSGLLDLHSDRSFLSKPPGFLTARSLPFQAARFLSGCLEKFKYLVLSEPLGSFGYPARLGLKKPSQARLAFSGYLNSSSTYLSSISDGKELSNLWVCHSWRRPLAGRYLFQQAVPPRGASKTAPVLAIPEGFLPVKISKFASAIS